jgi:hypothetical protein
LHCFGICSSRIKDQIILQSFGRAYHRVDVVAGRHAGRFHAASTGFHVAIIGSLPIAAYSGQNER